MSQIEKTSTDLNHLLEHMNAGIARQQVEAVLSEVARGVTNFGGKKTGKVSIEMDIRRFAENEDQIMITTVIKKKEPTKYGVKTEDVGSESVFFVGRGGKITFEQPKEADSGQFGLNQQKDGVVPRNVTLA